MRHETMIVIWIALSLLFAVGEALTVQITSVWFALGALVALFLTLFGVDNFGIQLAVFLAVSVVTLLATRPLVRKLMKKRVQPTNADRCIGETGVVTTEIDNTAGKGEVNLKGTVWTARSSDERVIPVGSKVRALRIEGVKLIVETTKNEEE